MTLSPLAGKPAPENILIDVAQLDHDYFANKPDPSNPRQLVSFGTSGHRGTPFDSTFTEFHILAITQAICEYRRAQGITGPLYMGKDTHAVSGVAQQTALEVIAAHGVDIVIQEDDGITPTPPSLTLSSFTTAPPNTAWPTASSSLPRTTRPPTAASNTIPPTVALPTRKSPAGFRTAPTRYSPPTTTASSAPTSSSKNRTITFAAT